MGLGQLFNSIQQIVENPYVPTGQGLVRHAQWQLRKAFNRFPFEQSLAGSRIMAAHRHCAVSALINGQGLYDYNNMRLLQWLLRDGGTFLDSGLWQPLRLSPRVREEHMRSKPWHLVNVHASRQANGARYVRVQRNMSATNPGRGEWWS